MADSALDYLTNPLKSFFWGNDPNVNQQLRQRIALQMMQSKRAYPKTFGEGLAAIGDALGEMGTARSLLSADAASAAAGAAEGDRVRGSASSSSYAPSDDTPPVAPAVKAINNAISPPDVQVVDPTEKNVIDEQADKPAAAAPAAARLSDIVATLESGGGRDVASQPPTMVDKTYGQFPAFAKQYGSGPAGVENYARKMLAANPKATLQDYYSGYVLGTGNAAKPPTVADLQTKYPAAYNNLARHAGVPLDTPLATLLGGRDAITAAAMSQQQDQPTAQAVPPANPTPSPGMSPGDQSQPAGGGQTAPDQRLAFSDTNATPLAPTTTDIKTAPPLPPQITTAPTRPVPTTVVPSAVPTPAPAPQVAQNNAVPPPQYGYVPPEPTRPPQPPPTPLLPIEVKALAAMRARPNDIYLQQNLAPDLAQAKAIRDYMDKQNNEQWTRDVAAYEARVTERQKAITDQAKDIGAGQVQQEEFRKAKQENDLRAQFGNMPPAQVFDMLKASQSTAEQATRGLQASKAAMDAFGKGVITGSGAYMKLDAAKFATAWHLANKSDLIANTETFKAAMQPVVAALLHQTSGNAQLSDTELAFAKAAAAGDITLDAKTIPRVMEIINKGATNIINDHQNKMTALFGDNKQAQALYGVQAPSEGPGTASGAVVDVPNEAAAMQLPKGTRVRINGRTATVN